MDQILILGFARTGKAVAKLCSRVGVKVYIYEEDNVDIENKETNIKITGLEYKDISFDKIIVSPGFKLDHHIIKYFQSNNIPVISELEFSAYFSKHEIIAVTGTNGKGTTCTLIAKVLENAGFKSIVLGNIGIPFAELVLDIPLDYKVILETSCAQLSLIDKFHPKISVVTNLKPEHLNFYNSFEEYITFKKNISKNQTIEDTIVLNLDDQVSYALFQESNAKKMYFSTTKTIFDGSYIDKENYLVTVKDGNELKICKKKDVQAGLVDNSLAALIVGNIYSINSTILSKTIKDFKGLEHAIELCGRIEKINFYNDSKSTNEHSTIHALNCLEDIILITGGKDDKNCDYFYLSNKIKDKVKFVFIIGETKSKLQDNFYNIKYENFKICNSLADAVQQASDLATNTDNILFSPAANSKDMFVDHKVRGNLFKKLVAEYLEQKGYESM
ncbi:UDP-N-acetylmuramoyl-L-alanine--D-glutamate ligase [Larkinella punicea]|uniref:UDP-N-acetylmuramoylalanine--D-glutamate ligase n=1 Tax=Larkinella punicea TaxID=2315727 RepID=A0A368JNW5_9BACT|nr:UDP-N-acetylmuramoyl-L-alanine--D-glutamate ligase [Larkinella punicea]RCR68344.1 UDP-N-acetylmuramoyl-L-alanine--D-glutamate ligase [Larkinella punicea]